MRAAEDRAPIEIVIALLKVGGDPSITDNQGFTALHRASENGHTECVETLIQHGANPNLMAPKGYTPLMMSEAAEYKETSEALMHSSDLSYSLLSQ